MASAEPEGFIRAAERQHVQEHWRDRETITIMISAVSRMAQFLTQFERSCQSRLARVDDTITMLERKLSYMEARLDIDAPPSTEVARDEEQQNAYPLLSLNKSEAAQPSKDEVSQEVPVASSASDVPVPVQVRAGNEPDSESSTISSRRLPGLILAEDLAKKRAELASVEEEAGGFTKIQPSLTPQDQVVNEMQSVLAKRLHRPEAPERNIEEERKAEEEARKLQEEKEPRTQGLDEEHKRVSSARRTFLGMGRKSAIKKETAQTSTNLVAPTVDSDDGTAMVTSVEEERKPKAGKYKGKGKQTAAEVQARKQSEKAEFEAVMMAAAMAEMEKDKKAVTPQSGTEKLQTESKEVQKGASKATVKELEIPVDYNVRANTGIDTDDEPRTEGKTRSAKISSDPTRSETEENVKKTDEELHMDTEESPPRTYSAGGFMM
eukprot:Clim_evm179s157 gene=Clim_evmTU179s157